MIQLNVVALARGSRRRSRRGSSRAREGGDHQHLVDRGGGAGGSQRRVWRHEGVRACVHALAAARARRQGVRVQAVFPGATRTGFWDIAGHPAGDLP